MSWARLLTHVFGIAKVAALLYCALNLTAILWGVVQCFFWSHTPSIVGPMIVCGCVALLCLLSAVLCDVLSDYFKRRI